MRPARTARVKRPHVCAAALPFSPQLLGTMCERRAGGVVITGGGDGRPEEAEEVEEVEEGFPAGISPLETQAGLAGRVQL